MGRQNSQQSPVMPNTDPWDRFINPYLTLLSDSYIVWRSTEYLSFLYNISIQSLQSFHVPHVFEDISEAYWAHEKLTKEVLDEHIPIKQKHKRKNSAPFMNSELRKAINHKKSLWRKFQNVKSDKNWNKYSKQRNYVTKLKRESSKLYFSERCGGGQSPRTSGQPFALS